MVESAKHGGVRKIKVNTESGEQELTLATSASGEKSTGCGCLCTPETSSSLLTTAK